MSYKKWTKEELLKLFESYEVTWVEGKSEYTGFNKQIYCIDSEGYECMLRISDLQRNYGIRRFYGSNPYTMNNIKLWLIKNSKNIELIDGQEYVSAKSKLKFKCLECGEIFSTTWDSIHSGRGCLYCCGKKVSKSNCFATRFPEFVMYFKYPEIANYITIGYKPHMIVVCPDCGFEKPLSVSDLKRRGFSCNNCNPDFGKTRTNNWFNPVQAERKKEQWLNTKTYVYVIRMFKDDESFYKIGLGYKGAKYRFASKNPNYRFDVLNEFETDLYNGIKIEAQLHELFSEYSYVPRIYFEGYTECFSEINMEQIEKFINDYKKE